MKKKIFGGILAVAIAAVAAVNVNINNEAGDALSALSLANVEALAQSENQRGAQSIIIVDGGTSADCINGWVYYTTQYSVTCVGQGNLDCEAGEYEETSEGGKCYHT